VKVARIEIYAFMASRVHGKGGGGLLITPSFTNRKDYTAELLCEEADNILHYRKK
jgi:hypothetical protein